MSEQADISGRTFTEYMAAEIAQIVFPHNNDRQSRNRLEIALCAFAAEIKRSAIEP